MSASTISLRKESVAKRGGLTVALALGALVTLPAIASAATWSISAGSMMSPADASNNNVTITVVSGTHYRIADTTTTPVAGAGCSDTGATVDCPLSSVTSNVLVFLGGGDDSFSAAGVNGGVPFNISDNSSTSVTEVTGSEVLDSIDVGAGTDDPLDGGGGDDTFVLRGNSGDGSGDEITGGAGVDRAVYATCGSAVTVTIDGANNDGGTCGFGTAGDDVHTDVENVTGSQFNDTITGSASSNLFIGGDGDDALNGGAGNDRFMVGFNNGDGSGDELTGGPDLDRADYFTCTTLITVTIDGANNDGGGCGNGSSAGDDVHTDVESVTGTALGDAITGSCHANTFVGDPGTTDGSAGGNDTLIGDPASCLAATSDGTEADFIGGGEGNDTFNGDGSGNPGFDTVTYGIPYANHAVSAAPCAVSGNRAVSVTLDDVANDCDGFGNTADNVHGDINRLIGSPLADSLNATTADQDVQLFGRLGDDLLTDGPFNDLLNGEGGSDTANCPNGGANVSLGNEAGTGC